MNNKLLAKGKEILEYKDKNPGSFAVPNKIVEEEEPVESEAPTKTSSSGILTGGVTT